MPGKGPSTEPVLVSARSSAGVRTTAVAVLLTVFSHSGLAWPMTIVLAKEVPGVGRTGEPPLGSIRSTVIWAVKGPALPPSDPTSKATWLTGAVGVGDQPPVSGLMGSKLGTGLTGPEW